MDIQFHYPDPSSRNDLLFSPIDSLQVSAFQGLPEHLRTALSKFMSFLGE